jgi:hypothetical protein
VAEQKERIAMTKARAKVKRKESSLVFVISTQPAKAAAKETRMTMPFCKVWRLLQLMFDVICAV